MELDIYGKIERFSDLGFGIDAANADKKALIESVIPDDIKQKIAEIEAEFDDKIEQLTQERSDLEEEIRKEVLNNGRSIKGTFHSFSFTKGRTSWDTKMLNGLAETHPELNAARKVGEPSVSIRKA